MSNMGKLIAKIALILFVISFAYQVCLELNHYSDSLGLWYTIYGSIVYTAILTALSVPIVYLMRKYKNAKKTINKNA